MKRYIDADKALNALEILKTDGKTDIPISGIEIYLNRTAITEADLMIVSETCPVTRCKDCVHYDGECWYATARVEAIDGKFLAKTLDGDDISSNVLMWMDFPKLKFEERF